MMGAKKLQYEITPFFVLTVDVSEIGRLAVVIRLSVCVVMANIRYKLYPI